MNKKGQVMQGLAQLGVGIAVLAIVLTVAFLIMSQGKEQISVLECDNASTASGFDATTCGEGYNATGTLQNATSTIPGWVPLIVIATIGAILLGLVAMFRRSNG